ncbi:hypothetical protein ACFQV2_30860 [Actinokineospora soli]|uniref:Uncharacterized protein n=1 Tax=Actinokineospora soli TaxID=1048753 RepID=A0ABW2TWI7_9PSEU
MYQPLRPGSPSAGTYSTCDVGGQRVEIAIRQPLRPTGAEPRVMTCDDDVHLLADGAREVSAVVRSELIILPVAMVIVGAYLFFPRLLWFMAWFSTPKAMRPGGGRA